MKWTIYLLLSLPFGLLSCQEKENSDEIKTLQETVDLLAHMNAENFHRGEAEVIRNGNLDKDRIILDEAKKLLSIISHDMLMSMSNDSLTDEGIARFQSEFQEYFTKNDLKQTNESDFEMLQSHYNEWKINGLEKDLLLMHLEVLRLQSSVVQICLGKLGHSIIDYFHGRVHFYNEKDTVDRGQQLTTIIILGEPELANYEYLELTDPKLSFDILRDKVKNVPLAYELEEYQRGAWLLQFTPEESGIYTISLATSVYSNLYEMELQFRGGSKNILVR